MKGHCNNFTWTIHHHLKIFDFPRLRNIHQVAIEMLKVKEKMTPAFMEDVFEELDRDDENCSKFQRPNVRTVKRGERSLRNFGPILWNEMLPDNIKKSTTLDSFKQAIKSWKPEGCPCELCRLWVRGVGYTQTCTCCT